MRIVPDDLSSDQVRDLLRLHLEAMHAISPPESVHALGMKRLTAPDITVWSAWEDQDLLGIGALRQAGDEGEIKSMRTRPDHVGRGVGRTLLRVILAEARARGMVRVSLETGTGEAFAPAQALYLSEGFVPCGPFGDYVADPFGRFYTLDLRAES